MPFNFSHGGNQANQGLEDIDVSTPFGYMFPELQDSPVTKLPADDSNKVIQDLKTLAKAMVESQDTPESNSTIPPGYTYWGQFIDHDVTATQNELSADITQEDFEPQSAEVVTRDITNKRRPVLDLDSLYGDGPDLDEEGQPAEARDFYVDGVRLKLGVNVSAEESFRVPGSTPNPELGLDRDLPRDEEGKAKIGDSRNDENTIISQLHLAMMKFHNAMVDKLEDGGASQDTLFAHARQLTTWHYQWLVVHDYLKSVTMPGMVDKILYGAEVFYQPDDNVAFMPLEFSVAAYRFGHSMVRNDYDFNINFGRGSQVIDHAPFSLLFTFTGGGGLGGNETLPSNWIIQWDRFFNHHSAFADRFARKIDTKLAAPLANLTNDVNEGMNDLQREINLHLATRNLLRGYLLSIPTGQHIARMVHANPLTIEQLMQGNTPEINTALEAGGFLENTPLWYYVLKEAEVQANGNCLGEVGSRIVAETIIGLIRSDPKSYMNNDWDPSKGVMANDGTPITTMEDLLRFAGVML